MGKGGKITLTREAEFFNGLITEVIPVAGSEQVEIELHRAVTDRFPA